MAEPPAPPYRSGRHDDLRRRLHKGYVDPMEQQVARLHVGLGRWASVLGNPDKVPMHSAKVLKFKVPSR